MKNCKLCKRSSDKVFIHNSPRSFPGFCTSCQEWMFLAMLTFVAGIAIFISGLGDLIFNYSDAEAGKLIFWGAATAIIGFFGPLVVEEVRK